MSRKILVGIAGLLVVALVAVAVAGVAPGAWAVFSDTETAQDNTLQMGTLDLQVDGQDDPDVVHIELDNLAPGDTWTHVWKLQNVGSLPGDVKVTLDNIVSYDNGCNEPEISAGDTTCGDPGEGELAGYLRTQIHQSHPNVESPIGWVISDYHAYNMAGYLTGCPNGGMLYIEGSQMDGQTLGAGDFQMVKISLTLDEDVYNDGAGWCPDQTADIDDNLLQSDSVEFDLIFDLVQN